MSGMKKSVKSKFLEDDDIIEFVGESQFLKDSPKHKKLQKRQKVDTGEEDMTKFMEQYQLSASKKKKADPSIEMCKESRQRILDVMGHQLKARKQSNENLLTSLADVLNQSEADYTAMKENEKKLEQLTGALLKCIQQATNAQKQKLQMIQDIHSTYKKEVEGLIKHNALKADDRPIWFDVYKAFPPISEPKFSKPVPDSPVRPILYHEDVIRAKFHDKGHGFGAVNMLTPAGETHTKKLIKQYYKLKDEGVPEEELIEKSAQATSSERSQRQEQAVRVRETVNPNSATAQILSEAALQNIFKEEK